MHANLLVYLNEICICMEKASESYREEVERKYRQTSCRPATTRLLLYIIVKDFTHRKHYK